VASLKAIFFLKKAGNPSADVDFESKELREDDEYVILEAVSVDFVEFWGFDEGGLGMGLMNMEKTKKSGSPGSSLNKG
jgi:hypothetical protein